jgi:hypothetical protein
MLRRWANVGARDNDYEGYRPKTYVMLANYASFADIVRQHNKRFWQG